MTFSRRASGSSSTVLFLSSTPTVFSGAHARSPCACATCRLEDERHKLRSNASCSGRKHPRGIALSPGREPPDTQQASGTQGRVRSYRTRGTRRRTFGESISSFLPPTRDAAGLGHSFL